MARQRTRAGELTRMLNSVDQPVYVLDDELTVVFCNRACCEWLGTAAVGLMGQRCAYHSRVDLSGPAAVAAALCPPPEAMEPRQVSAIVSCTGSDGRVLARRADFIPLAGREGRPIGLVAVLEPEDLPDAQAASAAALPDDAQPAELHEHVRLFRRQAAARCGADRLIGDSPAIRRVRAQVQLAATNHVNVLLVGPPGSGRQHVASAIHYRGDPHQAGSLIPLACSVLGSDLIRSTVLALATKEPLGEQSARSTLLLNQADEIPADVQAELAGLLAGRAFRLRLIATASRPLDELVRAGAYRAELAGLLSTITIELPPLARRREDVPVLGQLFLEEDNARGRGQLGGFTPEALDQLVGYPWPGNLDELAQVVAQARAETEGPLISVGDLPERIRLAADAAAYPARPEEKIVLDGFLARIERELISRAMTEAKGNKARAARLLGLSRPRLYRRLVQLGLEEEEA